MKQYDLCVIGSGPAGQKAAIQAAKLGKSVCVVERTEVVGGAAINTGTIPSKSLREAILNLTGLRNRSFLGEACQIKSNITIEDLTGWCQQVIKAEIEVVRGQLRRNGVDLIHGSGSFQERRWVVVTHGSDVTAVNAERVLIATGTRPTRPANIPFDNLHVVDADQLFHLPRLPKTMIVVGGGVIGTEYASMLQTLGVKVTLIEGRSKLLEFLDSEIVEALQYHLRQGGMTLRLGEKVTKVGLIDPPQGAVSSAEKLVEATLESGKTLRAECLLYCVGRQGNTEELALEKIGLAADDRGRIKVDANFQTEVQGVYAVGDVIGFPALASTSMEQGRLAVSHMFGNKTESLPHLFPYGIYAIPEISMVGWTEDALTKEDIPFETGVANYREIARGQLLGDVTGMLKLLIHQQTRAILGVHCIGNGATEIIHIGQAVMAFQGTVDYFINAVFNYPTLAECYKVAALNGANKLAHV
ncbi:MAG TPA: Si-specific NAD(P)(+) transhydrogenase [Phycisphaerales bacterium]|nr:Si-specific NAD(P)(+) transhydrogenase [Phycisphaerales bacterium]